MCNFLHSHGWSNNICGVPPHTHTPLSTHVSRHSATRQRSAARCACMTYRCIICAIFIICVRLWAGKRGRFWHQSGCKIAVRFDLLIHMRGVLIHFYQAFRWCCGSSIYDLHTGKPGKFIKIYSNSFRIICMLMFYKCEK